MYEVEIRNGLELFDKKLGRETWLPRVIPAHIEMNSCVNCIAAQATGGTYARALVVLGIVPEAEYEKSRENPNYPIPDEVSVIESHYGFEIHYSEYGSANVDQLLKNIATLQREWRNAIIAMQFPHPTQFAREAILSNA